MYFWFLLFGLSGSVIASLPWSIKGLICLRTDFFSFSPQKTAISNMFLGNTQNSSICSGDFLFLSGVIAFRLFSILSKGSSLLSGVISTLSGGHFKFIWSHFILLPPGKWYENHNQKSRQVLPNSLTEYMVDALFVPLKMANRIGMWLSSEINCANRLYFPVSVNNPRFFLNVLLFNVIHPYELLPFLTYYYYTFNNIILLAE